MSHCDDARIAAEAFWAAYPRVVTAVTAPQPFSLVGAALLRAGLTGDVAVLSQPVVVIRAGAQSGR